MDSYPVVRDLDGYFSCVQRDGKRKVLCFTDLTRKEQEQVTEDRSAEELRTLALCMAFIARHISDKYDLFLEDIYD